MEKRDLDMCSTDFCSKRNARQHLENSWLYIPQCASKSYRKYRTFSPMLSFLTFHGAFGGYFLSLWRVALGVITKYSESSLFTSLSSLTDLSGGETKSKFKIKRKIIQKNCIKRTHCLTKFAWCEQWLRNLLCSYFSFCSTVLTVETHKPLQVSSSYLPALYCEAVLNICNSCWFPFIKSTWMAF